MKQSVKFWVRGTALPLTLLLGLSIVAPHSNAEALQPAVASSAPNPKPLATAAAARLAAVAPAEAALATTQATPNPTTGDGKSFFKSPKGVLALTLAIVGVGYVMYSSHHDRLHTQIPK